MGQGAWKQKRTRISCLIFETERDMLTETETGNGHV